MSSIAEWLSSGDLRSDGAANEVVDLVLQNPDLIEDVIGALRVADDVVRGHAADALEKIARSLPALLGDHVEEIMTTARRDEVPMVRWHLAMILGHLTLYEEHVEDLRETLIHLLDDGSVFVQSWSIVSLCIIARAYPQRSGEILSKIERLKKSESPAVRTKVRQAVSLLIDPGQPFPKGWLKSKHLRDLDPGP
jgi:HEAT repeat protein